MRSSPAIPEEKIESRRQNNFDFLRFAAAMLVFMHHALQVYGKPQPALILKASPFYLFGGLGVATFFFISGFLVTGSWKRNPHVIGYLKSRALRIYPALLINCLLLVMLVGPFLTSLSPAQYFHLIFAGIADYAINFAKLNLGAYDIPGLPADSPFHLINMPVWTLAFEFKMYLLVLLAGVARLLDTKTFFIFAMIGSLLYGADALIYGQYVVNVYCMIFMVGMFYYVFRDSLPLRNDVALLCLTAMVLLKLNEHYHWFGYTISISLLIIAVSYMVYYIAFCPWLKLNHFGKYGDLSYGLYIYHYPALRLFYFWFGQGLHFLSFCAATLALILLLAFISWHCVEKPFLRLKFSRLFGRLNV